MADDQFRRQVVLDHESSEHGLPDDPQGQQAAEEREMPAVGPAEESQEGGGDDRQADEAGQQPVAVLDPGVDLGGGDVTAVTLGPVGATEAGSGQPHCGPGEDDQDQRDQRDQRDLRVAFG